MDLKDLEKRAIQYFMDYTNFKEDSLGYGLTIDDTKNKQKASIAASGFMLTSLIIQVERGYLSRKEALNMALKTAHTFIGNVPHYHGFFAHFVHIHTAKRYKLCEFSTIDTMLLVCGLLVVDDYFKDESLSKLVDTIVKRIDFDHFVFDYKGHKSFHMSYNPDQKGAYVTDKPGFIHQWDMFAEQLMMYIIYAGLGDPNVAKDLYAGFSRKVGSYQDISYIYTPGNALFVYQYPLCYLDFNNLNDAMGINWLDNAQKAVEAHYLLSQSLSQYFNPYVYGFTAGMTKHGYRVFGGLPNVDNKVKSDGTIHPHAIVGSLTIDNEKALKGINHMLKNPKLHGKYGFVSGYSDYSGWVSKTYLGIDKGLEMCMINNYLDNHIRHHFMNHPLIVKGLEVLNFKKGR